MMYLVAAQVSADRNVPVYSTTEPNWDHITEKLLEIWPEPGVYPVDRRALEIRWAVSVPDELA